MDRKKHLINAHAYSTAFQFDKLHIGRRQAQPRPAKHFQKAKAKVQLIFQKKQDCIITGSVYYFAILKELLTVWLPASQVVLIIELLGELKYNLFQSPQTEFTFLI